VVDDNADLRRLLALLIETLEVDVATAEDGLAALGAVERRRPDLILLDMKMPVMDGWTFVQELDRRAIPRPRIVVLTAAADPGDRAAEVGAEAWLPKPFDPDGLLELVEHLTRRPVLAAT
jgi:two-component system, chemotaxis family, chemotaxis protein CheY